MNYLLDTHALLWLAAEEALLSTSAKKILQDKGNLCFASIASLWEIAIKVNVNKLRFDYEMQEFSSFLSLKNDISILPIELNDLEAYRKLPHHHRDPFDRMLVSQCISRNLAVISKDPIMKLYNVPVFW